MPAGSAGPNDNYDGGRLLTVCKANYGPPKLRIDAKPVRAPSGERVCGFVAGGGWQTRAEHAKAEAEAKRGAAAGGAGKPAAGAAVDPYRARGAGRTVTAAELAAARLAARTADEILDAEARIAWAKMPEHHGAECPPALAALTPAALADWAPRTLLEVRGEVVSRLADSLLAAPDLGPLAAWPPPGDWPPSLLDALDPARGARAVFALAVSYPAAQIGGAQP